METSGQIKVSTGSANHLCLRHTEYTVTQSPRSILISRQDDKGKTWADPQQGQMK